MKKSTCPGMCFVVCFVLISLGWSQQSLTPILKLEDGTPIKLRLNRTLSSADEKVNNSVDFEVLEEVKIGDTVVVAKGATALATVTEAVPKRRMARGGKLNVNIDSVRLVDGEKAALRAVKQGAGGGHTGAMTGAMVATGIVFFPAAPLFLFMHGKDIVIPKGTEITAYISGDMKLEPTKFSPALATTALQTPATTASDSAVTMKSNVDGAEITVDGKYFGSTPSTVRLAPGDHEIEISKAGFKVWKRKMTVTAGSNLTLDASLEKEPPAN